MAQNQREASRQNSTKQGPPCALGSDCKIPGQRQTILERTDLSPEQAQEAIDALPACDHAHHPADWFIDPGVGYATEPYWRREYAKYVCFNQCPIRLQCLQEGFKPENMDYGTYGGYYVEEREAIREEALRRRGD